PSNSSLATRRANGGNSHHDLPPHPFQTKKLHLEVIFDLQKPRHCQAVLDFCAAVCSEDDQQ
ncbi:hypothetical protein OC835_008010, partial [Tilletia horrida]